MRTTEFLSFLRTVFTLSLIFVIFPSVSAQRYKQMTLSFNNEPLSSVLKKIEKSGEKNILFTYKDIDRYKVTAKITQKTQREALGIVLSGKPFGIVEHSTYFVIRYNKNDDKAQMVRGTVSDENNRPLSFANVVMLTATDSTYAGGCVTAEDGSFVLPYASGKYILKVSFMGYRTQYVPCRLVNDIRLTADVRRLEEVTVKSDVPAVEARNGAFIARVLGTPLENMGSAEDLIGHLPFVTGRNGSWEVIGRGAPDIYLNGRKLLNKEELKNLRAEDILRAEIITTPGARYGSSVNSVIVLRTVRKRGEGFSGSLYSGGSFGHSPNGSESVYMNYRTGGLDVFINASVFQNKWESTSKSVSEMNTSNLWQSKSRRTTSGYNSSFNGKVGFNYEVDANHSFGLQYSDGIGIGNNFNRSHGPTVIRRDGDVFDEMDFQSYSKATPQWGHSLNGYYNGTLGKWTIDFNADYYTNKSENDAAYSENGSFAASTGTNVNNDLYAVKLIASVPLSGGNLSFGTEETFTDRHDVFSQSGFSENADNRIRQSYYAGFAEYARSIWRLNFLIGLRFEFQRTKYQENGEYIADQSPIYRDWIPTFSVGYNCGKLCLSLAYRMMKFSPSYSMLTNSISYESKYEYNTGDPQLVPQKHHYVSLGGVYGWLSFNTYFDYTKNMYTTYFKPYNDDTHPGVVLSTMATIPNTYSFGLYVVAAPTIGVWNPRLSVSSAYYSSDASSLGIPYNRHQLLWTFSLDSSWSLPHNWFINLTGNVSTYARQAYSVKHPSGQIDLRVQKSFFKEKNLQLALWINDILHTGIYRFTAYGDRVFRTYSTYQDGQRIGLSVYYRFNATKSKYKGTGAGQDEKKRL